jgi:hypothetical protein
MENDGSANKPWSTLRDVVAKGLIATNSFTAPYRPGAKLQPFNATGVIHSGDVIYLRNGNHGDVVLSGVNDKFITIEAEPGQNPIISRLTIYGASKWAVRGITFRNGAGGNWLVQLLNHKWHGPSDNIIFERNTLLSNVDANTSSTKDWISHASSGIKSDAMCSAIRFNRLTNIRTGIMINGANSTIEGNVIDHFADDGIDVTIGNISILANRITNNHNIADGNHNDGIQGWTFSDSGNDNVVIADNVIINSTKPLLALPGELQGITIFDGKWRNVRVVNNCVRTNVWHGIALYGVRDSVVEGNTVIASDPQKKTWITVTNMKAAQGGMPPRNVIVRNNVAPRFVLPDDKSQVLSDGNKTVWLEASDGCSK